MPIRNLSDVMVLPGRIRKEFAASEIETLITSILTKGLLHPPVVLPDGTLLVGERRLRALTEIAARGLEHSCNGKILRPGLIYTTDIRSLNEIERLEAELEENTVRVDISWQEKAQATEALHRLRQLQKEAATIPGLPVPIQTPAETAAEIRDKPSKTITRHEERDVRSDLIVATWIANHPNDTAVCEAKTRVEALKAIEITLENEHRASLAKRFLLARPTSGHIVRQIDLRRILPDTPANIYDVIITDPPWGVGADTWTNGDSVRRHAYVDDVGTAGAIYQCLAVEGFRVAKERAHLYLFCAFQNFSALQKQFAAVGWDVWPRPLIWWRGGSGIAPRPEHGPRNTYECILFANKGNKRIIHLRPDVIFASKPAGDSRAAQKPVSLYYDLLVRSVVPGDEVIDPCAGTGPILPAANALKVRATCYDTDDEAVGLMSKRLEESYTHVEVEHTVRAEKRRTIRG